MCNAADQGQGWRDRPADEGGVGREARGAPHRGMIAMPYDRGDWRSRGACLTADPDLFFPLSSVGPSVAQITRAKRVCGRCPVRSECLEFALATCQVHGIWGGTSEDERRRLRARGGAQQAPAVLAGRR